jgi:hypothetical protein
MESIVNIMFIVVPILVFSGFIFTFALILSPKLRGKLMSKQIDAANHMMKHSKNSLSDLAGTALDIKKSILAENGDVLKEMYTKEAEIEKEGIRIKTSAIKEGLSGIKTKYCKHCGSLIDGDSTFCKSCGKKQ